MQKLYREDKQNIMNKNVQLIKDVTQLRNIVAAKKREFAKLGGQKAFDMIQDGSGVGDAEEEGDVSMAANLRVRQNYIAELQERLEKASRASADA